MSSTAADSADETESFRARMPFAATLGLADVVASRDAVQATLAWDPSRCTTVGTMHGGAIMALADSIGGYCAFLNLPDGAAGTTTIESKTNFLRPVRGGKVHATARPLQVGRTVIVVDTEMRDDDGRLVARTTQTQAVLQPR
ncbi:MAG: PaaI family thioesterase [Chloroflexi bacterium]|nr:PaaI family thioesterase [Chloroflexota bacterium]